MTFESLALCQPLLKSLQTAGYRQPTPIQEKAIPHVLKGRDLVGCAQTGTGKTAAFAIPTLQRLIESSTESTGAARRRQRSGRRPIRALILAPTRELASQIGESFATYGKFTQLRHTVIFGGVRQGPQVRALQSGVDVLVATPGRLLDLIGQGFVQLASVEILILDEADHMLDMGFIHDLRKIVKQVPVHRQTLLFSATMPAEIRELAKQWLRRPFEVKVAAVASTPELVSQTVWFVERPHKTATLSRFLQANHGSKTLVFSRTKRGADKIVRLLQRDGIHALAIHGNKSQARRKAVIHEFGSHQPPVLVATDLAARGLDFSDVAHVINYDLPDTPETYVHRIGRTARAGASGHAISFCSRDERPLLRMIEKLTGQQVPVKQMPADSDRSRKDKSDGETEQGNDVLADQKQSPKDVVRGKPRSRRGSISKASTGSKRGRYGKSSSGRRNNRSGATGSR
jgi:ATP-dependent RNA helicase RhlE